MQNKELTKTEGLNTEQTEGETN